MFDKNIEGTFKRLVPPWKTIHLDPGFSGRWMVAGDVDNDGEIEFITARNENQEITTILVSKLDGSTLWTWGKKERGGPNLYHDLPLQIYDITGDGNLEVVFNAEGAVIILEGSTGREITSHPLPRGLEVADCITFANFTGKKHPTDIIIKSRYKKIWAYTSDWDLVWTWPPGDESLSVFLSTCHHPEPFDIDGDGKDELLGSNIMLDHDGTEMWHINSDSMGSVGHLDALRVVHVSRNPSETRMIVSYCGGNSFGLLDGNGEVLWEKVGAHYESPDVGIINEKGELGVFIDVDHLPKGESRAELYKLDGTLVGTYRMYYGRQHRMVDWTGNGIMDIVLGNARAVVDTRGEIVTGLDIGEEKKWPQEVEPGAVSIIDVTGNGRGDIVLHSNDIIYIFKNPSPPVETDASKTYFRDEVNFTFY